MFEVPRIRYSIGMGLRRATMSGAAVVVVGFAGILGLAAQESSDDGVILHEYFDPASISVGGSSEAGRGASAPSRTAPSAGQPPGLTLDAGGGDVVLGPEGPLDRSAVSAPYGPRSPRSGTTTLDDQTDRVDDLDYHAAFDPSVFPYKRTVVQNRATRSGGGEYQMTVDPGESRRVHVVGGEAHPHENTFWGTFLVRAKPDEMHPIPSVGPEQRILKLQTEPSVDAGVYRDEAGNFYVEVDHRGLVRLNALLAVPRFYFDGQFSSAVEWSAFGEERMPELDDDIEPVAARVLSEIGVGREMAPADVVRKLVYYFRNFETKPLSEDRGDGDLYETISRRQVGVCRHRSLAFVITAHALGIPARYVTNEAHAFAEIFWPRGGWRRIDLGGAAREISYNGDRSDRLHDGATNDPLPQPPRYREELQEMRGEDEGEESGGRSEGPSPEANGDASGESDRGDRREPDDRSEESGSSDGTSESSSDGAGRGGEGSTASSEGRNERSIDEVIPEEERAETDTDGGGGGSEGGDGSVRRTPTELSLRTGSRTVFRGSTVTLSGDLRTASNRPLAGEPVRIYFGRVGAEPSEMEQLGTTETDERGRYRVRVTVPETTGIGRWALVAVYPGDDEYERARAD